METFRIDPKQINSFVKRETFRRFLIFLILYGPISLILISSYEFPQLETYIDYSLIIINTSLFLFIIFTIILVRKKAKKTVFFITKKTMQRRIVDDFDVKLIDEHGDVIVQGELDKELDTTFIDRSYINKNDITINMYSDYYLYNSDMLRLPKELENYQEMIYHVKRNAVQYRYILMPDLLDDDFIDKDLLDF